jgi:HopA1 effector protein family
VTVAMDAPPEVVEALDRLARLVGPAGAGHVRVAGVAVSLKTGSPGEELFDSLMRALYAEWYILPPESRSAPTRIPWRADMRSLLRAAHVEGEHYTGGWVVAGAEPDGRCTVTRNGSWRMVRPGEYVAPLRPGSPPARGEVVETLELVEWADEERGFWWAEGLQLPKDAPMARVYLNVRADTVAHVLHAVTAGLRDAAFPYSLKSPLFAGGYQRVDTLVIYHERQRRDDLRALLETMHGRLATLLEPATPPLTQRGAPGLAYADDPAGRLSFGESRCRALGAGVVAAIREGATGRAVVGYLLDALSERGIDPTRPWLDLSRASQP